MCGIAGVVDKSTVFGSERMIALGRAMTDCMRHRGPDDEGIWLSPGGRVALSQRRLSIIDTSSGGHQPMVGARGDTAITYNGELYNFRELKVELEHIGVEFKTKSDTEVLLAAIERWGVGAFARFDAMFALGFYDSGKRTLLLARDIFGEKPLYYIDTPHYFAFASELQALSGLPDFDPSVDVDTIAGYLSFQYVASPSTVYRTVRKLPPASWLRLDADGRVQVHPYFAFNTDARQRSTRSLDDLGDELEALLITTINRRLISDVPLGAFLSGGVDFLQQ